MTAKYCNGNRDENALISKAFIKDFLNIEINANILKKVKTSVKLNSRELVIMNNLLTIYLKKMNISYKKFLQHKAFFQFYV
jgi:hypothetical protein